MRFRTEISVPRPPFMISHDTPVTLLGSCFTDEVGERLRRDGFDVTANPFGPVYNPVTLSSLLTRALDRRLFTADDLTDGPRGRHCLDVASRFSGESESELLMLLNETLLSLSHSLEASETVILTLGSAYVFTHLASGRIVGNCHKFPADSFSRRRLTVKEVIEALLPPLCRLTDAGKNVILTVSPIRHLADGLHGNTLGKATLHLAADSLCDALPRTVYFPAYEALMDDLRDYRFYAEDMKHPSAVAVDYIYELFSGSYFSPDTRRLAEKRRNEYKRTQHRQIL